MHRAFWKALVIVLLILVELEGVDYSFADTHRTIRHR